MRIRCNLVAWPTSSSSPTDVGRAIRFYGRTLGLRLSDRSGDGIAFLHGIHGSDHHMIAFAKSSAPGFHHVSWDLPNVNLVGLGAMQMADKGFSAGWGLGRHVLGSNYFHYVRDPWGSYCEYSSDIDYIPVTCEWDAGDHPAEDSLYLWGPEVPKDFVTNYEAAVPTRRGSSRVGSSQLASSERQCGLPGIVRAGRIACQRLASGNGAEASTTRGQNRPRSLAPDSGRQKIRDQQPA